jgi:hypothetical protein
MTVEDKDCTILRVFFQGFAFSAALKSVSGNALEPQPVLLVNDLVGWRDEKQALSSNALIDE